MRFYKTGNIYKVIRMTGNQDNYLGVSFAENDENSIDLIEVPVRNPKKQKIEPSKDEVLNEVLSGLKEVNESLGTSYRLSKIYYAPSSDGPTSTYQYLTRALIRRYHRKEEFQEVELV